MGTIAINGKQIEQGKSSKYLEITRQRIGKIDEEINKKIISAIKCVTH